MRDGKDIGGPNRTLGISQMLLAGVFQCAEIALIYLFGGPGTGTLGSLFMYVWQVLYHCAASSALYTVQFNGIFL